MKDENKLHITLQLACCKNLHTHTHCPREEFSGLALDRCLGQKQAMEEQEVQVEIHPPTAMEDGVKGSREERDRSGHSRLALSSSSGQLSLRPAAHGPYSSRIQKQLKVTRPQRKPWKGVW